jgi:hypothetical protein
MNMKQARWLWLPVFLAAMTLVIGFGNQAYAYDDHHRLSTLSRDTTG